jgi:hypothetical protein
MSHRRAKSRAKHVDLTLREGHLVIALREVPRSVDPRVSHETDVAISRLHYITIYFPDC